VAYTHTGSTRGSTGPGWGQSLMSTIAFVTPPPVGCDELHVCVFVCVFVCLSVREPHDPNCTSDLHQISMHVSLWQRYVMCFRFYG